MGPLATSAGKQLWAVGEEGAPLNTGGWVCLALYGGTRPQPAATLRATVLRTPRAPVVTYPAKPSQRLLGGRVQCLDLNFSVIHRDLREHMRPVWEVSALRSLMAPQTIALISFLSSMDTSCMSKSCLPSCGVHPGVESVSFFII